MEAEQVVKWADIRFDQKGFVDIWVAASVFNVEGIVIRDLLATRGYTWSDDKGGMVKIPTGRYPR